VAVLNRWTILKEFIDADTDMKAPAGQEMSPQEERMAWHVRRILVENVPAMKTRFGDVLGEPEAVLRIPVHQTEQIPFRAMRYKESSR
jgi:hypothetical protein